MKNITAALIRARQNFLPLSFDKQGARNKYASYGAIKLSVERALNEENINIHFEPYRCLHSNLNMLKMVLIHAESGEIISGSQTLLDDSNSPIKDANQRYGAAITYAMRNLARTVLALHAEEGDLDDYGDEGDMNMITEKQLLLLKKLIADSGDKRDSILQSIISYYKVKDLSELPSRSAGYVISRLKNKNLS